MEYLFAKGENLTEAYHSALVILKTFGETVPCPDYDTTIIEANMEILVKNPFMEPMISKCGIYDSESLQQYKMEVEDGILDFMIGAGDNVWEYTYHQRIGEQLEWCIEELKRNPWSRRAVIDIRDNKVDTQNSHPACLQHIQFMYRNEKLDMVVTMRSNDAVNATYMNMFAFIMLQKKVADALGIEVGYYVHRANSFHAYEKDFEKLEEFVKEILNRDFEDLCYEYEGNWKILMENEIPKILEKVEDQKKKYNIK